MNQVYADTDFFLAIAKKEDWLKTNAQKLYNKHRGNIHTNILALVEMALISEKKNLDFEKIISSIFDIADVEGITIEEGMEIAHLINNKIGVFDAFHAVLSRGLPIVSSDHVYDKIGKERIKLE